MEPIGEHKARITLNSWEDARVVSADEALVVVGIGKVLRLDRTDRPAERSACYVCLNVLASAPASRKTP
jgi:hypothetical protein